MENFSFSKLLGDLMERPQSVFIILFAVLFGALMGWIPSRFSQSLELQERMLSVMEKHDANTTRANTARISATRYQNMLLRSICRNEAPMKAQGECEPKYTGFSDDEK